MQKAILTALCLIFPVTAEAEGYRVSFFRMFSRANCVSVNESITYSPYGYYANLETYAGITHSNGSHTYYSHLPGLARWSRAGCQFCSLGGYHVIGRHYLDGPSGWQHTVLPSTYDRAAIEYCNRWDKRNGPCETSSTADCSISVGWY